MKKVLLAFFCAFSVSAAPFEQFPLGMNEIPFDEVTIKKCEAKSSVAAYALMFRHRQTLEEMLDKWDEEWKIARHDTFDKYETYIDVQRIIRDAHRKRADGSYVMTNTPERIKHYIHKEMHSCVHFKF